jgi:plasmid stabilization system protein ParE
LIDYTRKAERQVDLLRQHYVTRERIEALRNLDAAIDEAERRIASEPSKGLSAPRPYPFLARKGRARIKAGRYWFSDSAALPRVIVGVFNDTTDIPSRF